MISACLRTTVNPNGLTSHTGLRDTKPFTSSRRMCGCALRTSSDTGPAAPNGAPFFFLHLLKQLLAQSVILTQSIKTAVDASVLFFQRDRQRKDFPFRQVFEILSHAGQRLA